jgi:hypothetical protein
MKQGAGIKTGATDRLDEEQGIYKRAGLRRSRRQSMTSREGEEKGETC